MKDSRPLICLVGRNNLQNRVLMMFLEREGGMKCASKSIPGWESVSRSLESDAELTLLDVSFIDHEELWSGLSKTIHVRRSSKGSVALYNVEIVNGIERRALEHGIRGVFPQSDSPGQFLEGVLAILEGQLWYPRETLSKVILETGVPKEDSSPVPACLTRREKEILAKIASGASNRQVARELYISSHTVKTHLHNIYKKTNVCNRLQAALLLNGS